MLRAMHLDEKIDLSYWIAARWLVVVKFSKGNGYLNRGEMTS